MIVWLKWDYEMDMSVISVSKQKPSEAAFDAAKIYLDTLPRSNNPMYSHAKLFARVETPDKHHYFSVSVSATNEPDYVREIKSESETS